MLREDRHQHKQLTWIGKDIQVRVSLFITSLLCFKTVIVHNGAVQPGECELYLQSVYVDAFSKTSGLTVEKGLLKWQNQQDAFIQTP